MTYYFYYLTAKNKVFYVGATRNNIYTRLSTHKSEAKNGLSNNANKAEKILENWDNIEIHELESLNCSQKEAFDTERYWIEQFRQWGFELTNSQGIIKYREKVKQKPQTTVTISKAIKEVLNKIKNTKGIFVSRFVDDAIKLHIKKRFPEYIEEEAA